MPYNVDKFTAQIASRGLASPNKFQVEFTSVPSRALVGGGSTEDLNLMCESAALAGRNVQSLLDRQYGLNREIAYNGPTYQPLNLSFLCSKDLIEKRILDRWNNICVDISKGYDVAYYQDYIGEMKVSALDTHGKKTFTLTSKEVWPKTVTAIELNHSTQNTPVRVSAELSYAYWESDDISTNRIGTSVTPKNQSRVGTQTRNPHED